MSEVFIVKVRQFVEEIAEVQVEASSPQEAVDLVNKMDPGLDYDWSDGDSTKDHEIFSVEDTRGREVLGLIQILDLNEEMA